MSLKSRKTSSIFLHALTRVSSQYFCFWVHSSVQLLCERKALNDGKKCFTSFNVLHFHKSPKDKNLVEFFFCDFFNFSPKSHNMNFIAFRHQEVKTSKCQTCNKEQRKALLQEEVCQCQIHKDKCGYSESSSHGEHLLHLP